MFQTCFSQELSAVYLIHSYAFVAHVWLIAMPCTHHFVLAVRGPAISSVRIVAAVLGQVSGIADVLVGSWSSKYLVFT